MNRGGSIRRRVPFPARMPAHPCLELHGLSSSSAVLGLGRAEGVEDGNDERGRARTERGPWTQTRLPSPQKLLLLTPLLLACLLGTGCKTYRDQSGAMRDAWVSGRYEDAAEKYVARARKKDDGKDGVIWHLEAATALRALGRFEESNMEFEEAALQIETYESKADVRLGNEAGALMSNQQNLPYEGRPYDKIMLHTYRALNYLALGEVDKARPEVIRAYQRQQDAVEENARRIEKARAEEEQSSNRQQIDAARNDPEFNSKLDEITRPLEGFQFYADYVNPFTVYLDALYFLHTGAGGSDRERAMKSFRRVIEVAGDNAAVQDDLAVIEGLAAAQPVAADQPLTYVILETGRGATRDQERIDIPIIVADVSYVGAAFPRLEVHGDYLSPLTFEAGGGSHLTQPLASMDAIIALDFKNEWPTIVTKTLISTVAKGAAAYAANTAARQQEDWAGLLMRIGTAIAQAAVNIADTRSWSTLPKQFEVARVPTPEDRIIRLTGGGRVQDVQLIDGTVNVVYVRSVTTSSPLLISQFKLK